MKQKIQKSNQTYKQVQYIHAEVKSNIAFVKSIYIRITYKDI